MVEDGGDATQTDLAHAYDGNFLAVEVTERGLGRVLLGQRFVIGNGVDGLGGAVFREVLSVD